jgi:hypothetical protein
MIINKLKNTALEVFRTVLLTFSNWTFPIVKRKDEKLYGEYRTKHVILDDID